MTNLESFVTSQSLCDTHEHLAREDDYCRWAPDVLADLFGCYTCNDLVAAGASEEAIKRILDSSDPDVLARFAGIREAWERCQFTGYGHGTRLMAQLAYGMEAINPDTLIEAHRIRSQLNRSDERLRLLRDQAQLDHVQVDLMHWDIGPDTHAPGFFFYDLSIRDFATGNFDLHQLAAASGVAVRDLATLREAMAGLFARHVRHVVAVKTQHAYDRSLSWAERDESEASAVLLRKIAGQDLEPREKECLGDWALDQASCTVPAHRLNMPQSPLPSRSRRTCCGQPISPFTTLCSIAMVEPALPLRHLPNRARDRRNSN